MSTDILAVYVTIGRMLGCFCEKNDRIFAYMCELLYLCIRFLQMKHSFFQIWLAALLMLAISPAHAQELLYDVDFVFDFDNRESHYAYEQSGTIFGVRLTPTIGVGFSDSLAGDHRLMAGITYIQPFGANWLEARVSPTLFYRYEQRGWRLHLGFVPYTELTQALPDYLRSDSLAFSYPNIQGALFQYRSRWGYFDAMCDWRGMMTSSVREAFRLIGGGRFNYKWFYTGGFVQMNHLSHSEKVLGVVDDVVVNPLLGLDMACFTPFDSLSLQVGYILTWNRDRRAHDSRLMHGLHVDAALRWRFIGFRNETYFGGNMMPFYSTYGVIANQGDPRYQSRIYNRTDLYLYLVRRPFVTVYAGWNLLYLEGFKLSHQQQLVCRFNLQEALRFSRLSKEGRHAEHNRLLRTISYR